MDDHNSINMGSDDHSSLKLGTVKCKVASKYLWHGNRIISGNMNANQTKGLHYPQGANVLLLWTYDI